MHLLPAFILLILFIIAWKYDLIGAIIFFILAIYYIGMVGLNHHWSWYAVISGPLILIGILFIFSWRQKKSIK
jgi:cell division protein FtsW (lipid II flippase)